MPSFLCFATFGDFLPNYGPLCLRVQPFSSRCDTYSTHCERNGKMPILVSGFITIEPEKSCHPISRSFVLSPFITIILIVGQVYLEADVPFKFQHPTSDSPFETAKRHRSRSPAMTGSRVSRTARPSTRGRRSLLARLQGLQRTLRDLRPCGCPDDCRGHGNVRPSTPFNNNNNSGDGGSGGSGNGGNGSGGDGSGGNGGGGGDGDGGSGDGGNGDGSGDGGGDGGGDGFLPLQVSRRASARVNSTVLARASHTKPATLVGALDHSPLRISLQVHGDPQGNKTRLGYYADLFLTPPGQAERYVGYISSWRLSKPPRQVTGQTPEPWVQEWLSGDLGAPNDDSRPFKETLRFLYDHAGQLLPMDRDDDNRTIQTHLGDAGNELVFIDMIWIKHRDATTGLQVSLVNHMKHTRSPQDRRLIHGSLAVCSVLSAPHCRTGFRDALPTHHVWDFASLVSHCSASHIRLESGHAVR